MSDKEKLKIVSQAFEDTIWMAIRYANGSISYAPGMVRDAVKAYKSVYPDWNPKRDDTIKRDFHEGLVESIKGDNLADLFNEEENV